eukprot:2739656-Ditylum_brightwellii.AAC.1
MIENPKAYISLETVPSIEDAFDANNLAGLYPSNFFGEENLEDPEAINAFLELYDEVEDKDDGNILPTDHFGMPPTFGDNTTPEEG